MQSNLTTTLHKNIMVQSVVESTTIYTVNKATIVDEDNREVLLKRYNEIGLKNYKQEIAVHNKISAS